MSSVNDKPQSVERSSSFARSFYRGAENPTAAAAAAAVSLDAESSSLEEKMPIPRSRPISRRQSSRRVSSTSYGKDSVETSSASVSGLASGPATGFATKTPDNYLDYKEGHALDNNMQGTTKAIELDRGS
jgi:hypothetical protein